ncbi:hypothetical protein [Blastococcus sp. SYSU D00813]
MRPRSTDQVRGALTAGAWALPVSGALLAVSTVTHQPSYSDDFPGYAAYVTTGPFLAGHLVASIFGAALGIVGVLALLALVADRLARPRAALAGAALTVTGQVLSTAVFGVAAFAQPAIGRAYRSGVEEAVAWNSDVYGPALFGTVGVALLAWSAGAVLVGRALAAADRSLRAAGLVYAVSLPLYYVTGPIGSVLQPVTGAVFTAAAVVLVRRASRLTGVRLPAPAAAG